MDAVRHPGPLRRRDRHGRGPGLSAGVGHFMTDPRFTFHRGAIRPIQCVRDAWRLVKDDYWLFLGLTVVGMLIGSFAPLGVLVGPMMCGIYVCLLRRLDGRRIDFAMLF